MAKPERFDGEADSGELLQLQANFGVKLQGFGVKLQGLLGAGGAPAVVPPLAAGKLFF